MSVFLHETSPSLDLLPPEILSLILQNVHHIKDLRALLYASPRLYQVFRTFRDSVVVHVARNQITPTILPFALRAYDRRFSKTCQRRRLQDSAAGEISGEHQNNRIPGSTELSYQTAKNLLKFHHIVESFIAGFSEHCLQYVEAYLSKSPKVYKMSSSTQDRCSISCSKSEYTRLARAFYNVDILGSIVQGSDPTSGSDTNWCSQPKHVYIFLRSCQYWELEELLCVRCYLLDRIGTYLNKIEDDRMQEFLENKPYMREIKFSNYIFNGDRYFSIYHHGKSRENWLKRCQYRGLEALAVMLTASTSEDRRDTLGRINALPDILHHALHNYPRQSWRAPIETGLKSADRERANLHSPRSGEDFERPNTGWRWAKDQIVDAWSSENYADDRFLEGQRHWGYAIWDTDRLEQFGTLPQK